MGTPATNRRPAAPQSQIQASTAGNNDATSGYRPVTEACHTRTVGVVQQFSVALVRAMPLLATRNRQDAARYLLRGALSRFGKRITIPELVAPERNRHKHDPNKETSQCIKRNGNNAS